MDAIDLYNSVTSRVEEQRVFEAEDGQHFQYETDAAVYNLMCLARLDTSIAMRDVAEAVRMISGTYK